MKYEVQTFDREGRYAATLGTFGNIFAARQAMLDHSNTTHLPTEEPFHVPSLKIAEGWFIGCTEYNIRQG